jgi:hypothetical protein
VNVCRLAETLGAEEGMGYNEDSSDSQPLKKDAGAMVRSLTETFILASSNVCDLLWKLVLWGWWTVQKRTSALFHQGGSADGNPGCRSADWAAPV